jgi:outer membrane protein assembly factor BamB
MDSGSPRGRSGAELRLRVRGWRGLLVAASSALLLAAASAEQNEQLWEAARQGDAATVRQLLDRGVDPNAEFREGGTALLFAAQHGHADVVELLLARGADVHARDRINNATALHFSYGLPAVVKVLVEHGADVNARDFMVGQTPLWWAVSAGNRESVRLLAKSGRMSARALKEALELAGKRGDGASVALLTETLAATAAIPSWPQFRGKNAAGIGDGESPPTTWGAEPGKGVRWKTEIPGLGHSSPVVWGDRLFVTTAVSSRPDPEIRLRATPMESAADNAPQSWRVYCLDRHTGKILWQRTAYEGLPKTKRSPKNSYASATPATDGKHLVVSFGSHGLYCYDLDGNLLWKRDLGVLDSGFYFDPSYQWGDASSPVLYQDLAILQCDLQKGSFLAAFNLKDGAERWRTARDELPSWGTPTLREGPGRPELITNGVNRIRGYDPATGKELWSLATGNSLISAATPVLGPEGVVVGNGYRPLRPLYAIRYGAEGEVAADAPNGALLWSKKSGGPYYVTPLVYGERLYLLSENGVLTNLYVKTGEEIYRHRVGDTGASFSASPVAADGRLYLVSETGEVYVVKDDLEYKLLATNPVGEPCMATPAIAGGMIYVRTRNHVLGIGGPEPPPGGKGTPAPGSP